MGGGKRTKQQDAPTPPPPPAPPPAPPEAVSAVRARETVQGGMTEGLAQGSAPVAGPPADTSRVAKIENSDVGKSENIRNRQGGRGIPIIGSVARALRRLTGGNRAPVGTPPKTKLGE